MSFDLKISIISFVLKTWGINFKFRILKQFLMMK